MSKMGDLYEKLPDDGVMNVMNAYGNLLSSVANNAAGCGIVELAHRAVGGLFSDTVKLLKLDEDRGPLDVGREFIEKFFGTIVESVSEDSEEWVFTLERCPYGFCEEGQLDLCRAAMNFEEEAIRRLGGELVIEERITEGASKCRLKLKNY